MEIITFQNVVSGSGIMSTDTIIQITFHQIEHSDAVESRIREKIAKLEKFSDQIISCRVVVESPHRHHHKGKLYNIKIDLAIPGHEILVNHNSRLDHSHEDIYVAIRDSFNEAKRQLQQTIKRQRGRVKSHEVPSHGKVTEIDSENGRGVIETVDGYFIHFNSNSVFNNAFKQLKTGSEVRFVSGGEATGEEPWATTVYLIGKHHIAEP